MARHKASEIVHAPAAMRGFSIVELMVALAISSLLLTGVIAIFLSSKTSYETTDRMSRIQENGRFALDQLTHDIRSTGFVGCSRETNYVSSTLNPTNIKYDFLSGGVQGFQYVSSNSWSPALPSVGMPAVISDGSDVLVLRLVDRDVAPLKVLAPMDKGTDDIVVENIPGVINAGDTALLYNCEAQAFFQVSSLSGGVMTHTTGGLNLSSNVYFPFPLNSAVARVNTVIYYIAPKNPADPLLRSLWKQVGNGVPEELVEGIEQMQIDYGVDTTSDSVVDTYQIASAVTDWKQVFSVRVALLVRSMDGYGMDTDKRKYILLSKPNAVEVAAANDRLYREVFSSTVSIRNKVVIN